MRDLRQFVEELDKDYISGAELLEAVGKAYPGRSSEEVEGVLQRVAHGAPSPASACSAAALCVAAGLGDPLDAASSRYESEHDLPEPLWFLWIAGYSYNWICNAGLGCCYFEFDDRHFADRIRVYDAIGAMRAVEVLREADLAFGSEGPGSSLEARQARLDDQLEARLHELSPRFWACGDEIFTRAFLYALRHPEHFEAARGDAPG